MLKHAAIFSKLNLCLVTVAGMSMTVFSLLIMMEQNDIHICIVSDYSSETSLNGCQFDGLRDNDGICFLRGQVKIHDADIGVLLVVRVLEQRVLLRTVLQTIAREIDVALVDPDLPVFPLMSHQEGVPPP